MTLEQKMRKARPSLRYILPVVMWSAVVYALICLIVGLGLFLWHPSSSYPVVSPNQTMMTVWGFLYASVGVAIVYVLFTKRWERLRALLGINLFYNIFWSTALLLRIVDGGTLIIAALFIGLSGLLSVTIIFFLPPDEATYERLT